MYAVEAVFNEFGVERSRRGWELRVRSEGLPYYLPGGQLPLLLSESSGSSRSESSLLYIRKDLAHDLLTIPRAATIEGQMGTR